MDGRLRSASWHAHCLASGAEIARVDQSASRFEADRLARFVHLEDDRLGDSLGWLILVVAALGGLGLSAFLILGLGAPLIFVPWGVLRLDASRFSHLVEEARLKQEQKLANKRG